MRDELAKFFKEIPPTAVKYSSYFLLGMIGPKYADINLGNMRYGLGLARRGWLTKEDVVNTRPYGKLKAVFKRL